MTKNQTRFSRTICAQTVAALASLLVFSACAKPGQASTALASNATDSVGCESFQNDFFDQLYKFPQEKKAFPSESEMRQAFADSVRQGRLSKVSAADQQRIADALTDLYSLLTVDAIRTLGDENKDDHAKLVDLATIDIGDSTTPEREALQTKLQTQLTKIQTLTQESGAPACAKQPQDDKSTLGGELTPQAGTLIAQWKASEPRLIYGALKTMATGYQSCDITKAPIVDKSTPDVQGIDDRGIGPDGIGHLRYVSDAAAIFRTNPYLENYRKPASSCVDMSKSPLIYDYGGRPSTAAGNFDLFKNYGGTSALGTDCSGFTYMALATSGLRIKKGTALSAIRVEGITSTQFTDPQKNGLTCLNIINLNSSNTLRAGDIVAKAGHVLMIKAVGADPFGIAGITNEADCTLANMDVGRFDFTIIQDSSVKNGIGMHIHKAADYFKIPDSSIMAEGMLGHAVNACKAKFGKSAVAKNQHVTIVRHSGTKDCVQAHEIQLAHQSCVATCPAQPALVTAANP